MSALEVLWIMRMVLDGARVVTIGYRSISTSARLLEIKQRLSDSFSASKIRIQQQQRRKFS